jgi:hypothetical protein
MDGWLGVRVTLEVRTNVAGLNGHGDSSHLTLDKIYKDHDNDGNTTLND